MNTIGWIGLAISHFGAVLFGVFATLWFIAGKYNLTTKDYSLRAKSIKPRKVPAQEQEWAVSNAKKWEQAYRNVVETSPEKFYLHRDQKDTAS